MLMDMGRRFGVGAAAAVLAAVAAAVALVATAFCLYALLAAALSRPAASAITALVFAALTVLIAMLAPKLLAAKPAAANRPLIDGVGARMAAEAGLALLGMATEMSRSRRQDRQEKVGGGKRRRR